jgi:hypothetical protein
MGWLYTPGASRADIVRELTARQENATRTWETLAHCLRGNVLWAVVQITDKRDNQQTRYIACYLLAGHGGCGWGYKDMDESMHPFYYSCPLTYLDLAQVVDADWRAKVRAHHRNYNRQLAIGQKVALNGSTIPWVIITQLRPLVGEYGSRRYRLPRRLLGDVL